MITTVNNVHIIMKNKDNHLFAIDDGIVIPIKNYDVSFKKENLDAILNSVNSSTNDYYLIAKFENLEEVIKIDENYINEYYVITGSKEKTELSNPDYKPSYIFNFHNKECSSEKWTQCSSKYVEQLSIYLSENGENILIDTKDKEIVTINRILQKINPSLGASRYLSKTHENTHILNCSFEECKYIYREYLEESNMYVPAFFVKLILQPETYEECINQLDQLTNALKDKKLSCDNLKERINDKLNIHQIVSESNDYSTQGSVIDSDFDIEF